MATVCVRMGLCSWTDPDLIASRKFYPSHAKSGREKLVHYAKHFTCVEVDSSFFSIPSISNTTEWAKLTPPGFIFHFKAFRLFTSFECDLNTLPVHIRDKIQQQSNGPKVLWKNLNPDAQQLVWDAFHESVKPMKESGKLGCVVFQFHAHFAPSEASRKHLAICASQVSSWGKDGANAVPVVVELRNNNWLNDTNLNQTIQFLKDHKIVLVSLDEPGQHLRFIQTVDGLAYARIHRREGKARVLSNSELDAWQSRIRGLESAPSDNDSKSTEQTESKSEAAIPLSAPRGDTTVYMLWNTNWEDHSIVNANNMTQRVSDLCLTPKQLKNSSSNAVVVRGTLHAFISAAKDNPVGRSSDNVQQQQQGKEQEQEVVLAGKKRGLERVNDSIHIKTEPVEEHNTQQTERETKRMKIEHSTSETNASKLLTSSVTAKPTAKKPSSKGKAVSKKQRPADDKNQSKLASFFASKSKQ